MPRSHPHPRYLIEEPLIRTCSFHHEAANGTTLDLSLLPHEAGTHTKSLLLESTFISEALIRFRLEEVKLVQLILSHVGFLMPLFALEPLGTLESVELSL